MTFFEIEPKIQTEKMPLKIKKGYEQVKPVQYFCTGPTMTKESEAAACNINNIMKKYEKGELIEHMNANPGRYEDLPGGMDYQLALNLAIRAKDSFEALPGTLRAKFNNDAETFLEFMENPENDDEKISLGLIAPETEPKQDIQPEPTPVAPEANIEPSA